MNNRNRRVVFLTLMAAVLCLAWTAASWAKPEVEVFEDETGQKAVNFHHPTLVDAPLGGVKRYYPDFSFYMDVSGDGYPELVACGENQTNGQVSCQVKDIHGKVDVCSFDILNANYEILRWVANVRFTGLPLYAYACGRRLADSAVECQLFDFATGALQKQFLAVPPGMDASSGLSLYMSDFDTDGNPATPEWGFAFRKASSGQVYLRLVNPLTGVQMMQTKVLNPNYAFSPGSIYFRDMDGDGIREIIGCARHRVTGQFACEVRKMTNGKLLKTFPLLTANHYVSMFSFSDFDGNSMTTEIIACGWHLGTKQLKCEVRKGDGKLYTSFLPLGNAFVP
jgi:hypothetical protein